MSNESVFVINPEACHKVIRKKSLAGADTYIHRVMQIIEGVSYELSARITAEKAIEFGFDPDGDDIQLLDTPIPWEHIKGKLQ